MFSESDLLRMTVSQLKDILCNLGRKKNGNKDSLVKKFLSATVSKNQKHIVNVTEHQCVNFQEVWSSCGNTWTDRLAMIPKLTLGFIGTYLTDGELLNADTENIPTRRVSDRSDALFRAGKVKKVLCLQKDEHVHIRASCGASMKNVSYPVYIAFKHTSPKLQITCANCSRPAGSSEKCSHTGALLIAILEAQKKGYPTMACTSRDASWPAPAPSKTTPCRSVDLNIQRTKYGSDPSLKTPYRTTLKHFKPRKVHAEKETVYNFAIKYKAILPTCPYARYIVVPDQRAKHTSYRIL